jgi:pyruvate/2-oxoglutarate/acetoin dehydrogenase E1 component
MKYVSSLNQIFIRKISKFNDFVVFGQNVSTGSCLGGLTYEFNKINGCKIFNTPNTENALVGMGFGLMLSGTRSALFLKQQDFLLLGVDQLRNTHNHIRQNMPLTSFTIVNIVMDSGYEGIQSSMNNLPDFCAISSCEGFTISSKKEAELIIDHSFENPGFRIISVSQRLFGTEILDFQDHFTLPEAFIMQYRKGSDLTIACFNFSLPQGTLLFNQLNTMQISASLYNITTAHPTSYKSILEDAMITGRLIIIDDSKSCISVSTYLELEALRGGVDIIHLFKRPVTDQSYRPHDEVFSLDFNLILNKMKLLK